MNRLSLIFTLPLIALAGIFVVLPKLDMPQCSPMLLDQSEELLCTQLTRDEKWRLPIKLEEVPPLYLKMLMTYEDKRFYDHWGVDPLALLRGLWQWARHGQIISGGSTITMQTVRLMKPRPRTILYKIEEILQALRLEWGHSKREILEMYLTLAPYGGNVEGLRAASLTYWQQSPMQFTPAQMALMVVIPQLPTSLRPHIYPHRAKQFRDKVINRLRENGILTDDQARESMSEGLPSERASFPKHALHVIQYFRQKYPSETIYKSTLIKKKQVALESLLRSEMIFFDPHQTAAALIVDNGTRNIIAYVGSADPLNETKNGYVDMVQAIRSPGSALKPLIYALAFDDNLIHPETLIEDVSTNFNGYMPTNFRDIFHGVVTIREALQQSLNIPVVQLLDKLGPGRFVDWLKHVDVVVSFSSRDHFPSLPIALGGVGIRLYDLVSLYCTMANEGQFAPLHFEPSSHPIQAKQLMQASTSWYVTRILEDAPAPDGIVDWFITAKSPIAFKTGTSYGARDAWCLGYTRGAHGHTVGVWTGRPDGSPSPNQLGRKTAAPILHKIFNTILASNRIVTDSGPPSEVLMVSGTQLPEALRWFRYAKASLKTSMFKKSVPLRILSPQSDYTYSLQKRESESYVPIPIKFGGGTPPFSFFVNGAPTSIPKSTQRDQRMVLWHPTKIGFYEITIIDQKGHTDSVTIRLVE